MGKKRQHALARIDGISNQVRILLQQAGEKASIPIPKDKSASATSEMRKKVRAGLLQDGTKGKVLQPTVYPGDPVEVRSVRRDRLFFGYSMHVGLHSEVAQVDDWQEEEWGQESGVCGCAERYWGELFPRYVEHDKGQSAPDTRKWVEREEWDRAISAPGKKEAEEGTRKKREAQGCQIVLQAAQDLAMLRVGGVLPGVDVDAIEATEGRKQEGKGQKRRPELGPSGHGRDEGGGRKEWSNKEFLREPASADQQ